MQPRLLTELVLATHNAGKIQELKLLLAPLDINTYLATDLGVDEPEETGSTFQENAILKAKYVTEKAKKPSLADDSGLVIPSLDGFPGIYTGRYSKEYPSLSLCFKDLEERLKGHRTEAYFETVLCLYFPDGHHLEFKGKLSGEVVFPARGEDGFCFDFVFQPKGEDKTLAEMGRKRKNEISHRAQALRKFIDKCN